MSEKSIVVVERPRKANVVAVGPIVPVGGAGGVADWDTMVNKPLEFPPEAHAHDYETTGAAASAVSAHESAANPHPVYLTQVEGDALYEDIGAAAAAVSAHEGAADPHTGYQKESEKGAANGYAPLGADSKVPSGYLPSVGASFRNKIINGDFRINQRSYVSAAAVGSTLYGHDRWKMAASADTYTYSTTANKTTVTIPAGKILQQVVEGLNLQTGTYVLSWEGTAQGKIGAGSLSASGVTGLITGGTNTTIEFGPGTLANIQLELDSAPSTFESRPYSTELALCQRYYYRIAPGAVGKPLSLPSCNYSTTSISVPVQFPVTMRIDPTALEQSGTANQYAVVQNGIGQTVCNAVPTFVNASKDMAYVGATVASGLTVFQPSFIRCDVTNGVNAYLGWSAEL